VYCSRRLLVHAVAEDVTSKVFLKVAAHFSGISGSSAEDFRRWIFRITTDELNTQLRQSIIRREMLKAAVRMGAVNSEVSTLLVSSDTPVDWEDIRVVLNGLPAREPSIISLQILLELIGIGILKKVGRLKPVSIKLMDTVPVQKFSN